MSKNPTTIEVSRGITLVIGADHSPGVLGALRLMIDDARRDFADEEIAELLVDDDRFGVARHLIEHPEKLEQIAKLVEKERARLAGTKTKAVRS